MSGFSVNGRRIGTGARCYIIAEAGVNHNGDIARALALVDAAAACGADAVKFQTFRTDALVTDRAEKAGYQQRTTGDGGAQAAMLRKLELDEDGHRLLIARCREQGITFLSTPYDPGSVDLLVRLGAPALKIASTDTTNTPFLSYAAGSRLPLIVSTGMCSLGEVEAAVKACRDGGCEQLALLHCTSEYPAPPDESNLRAIATLAACFGVPVGFSDHTPGLTVGVVAAALGAAVLEKHFTLDRSLPGPDHAASLEPAEMQALVEGVRLAESALGTGVKRVSPAERANKTVMQKSLVAARHIAAGEVLTREMLTAKRPATGLSPSLVETVVGARARRSIARDEALSLAALDFPA